MEEEKFISEFNEAKFQIYRLHNLWLESKSLREQGKLIKCIWKLDSLTIELWNDAIRLDEESEEQKGYMKYTKKLDVLDKELSERLRNRDFILLYKKLIEKERLLKEIQEKAGKGAKFRPADDDYM